MKKIRVKDGVINARIVMPGAKSLSKRTARYKLAKYVGYINRTKYFAVLLDAWAL